MANKSSPATQSISVPQGGGSVHGIGETFSPDPHSGTGNFTVPIARRRAGTDFSRSSA